MTLTAESHSTIRVERRRPSDPGTFPPSCGPLRSRAGSRPVAVPIAGAMAVVVALATLVGCSPRGPAARMGSGVLATTTTTIPVDPALEDIVAGAGMTELGRRLFLDASPSVEDADALGRSCADVDTITDPEGTHTFGCLIAGRIHLRSFPHPEVRDLVYVVAAHELLHVAYGRLTRSELLVLEPELQAARLGNDLLEERLEVYAEVAEDTPNEVHSLLGTEFAGLSPVLERHYERYFDRARVLEVFRRTLGDREDEIRALKATVEAMEARLDAIQAELDRQDAAGDFEGYNANVTRFNALVAEHNAAVRQVNALVDEDNRLTG